ncbi:MAG TPA: hypothetical protein DCO86_02830 [Spirochaetaceae bacterium]|nr:hypothetical protein [Spirochaetaceae bacterium]
MWRKFCILSSVLLLCLAQSAFSIPGIVCAYEPNRNDGKTSSGVPFNPFSATCAHVSLPFGTSVAFTCGDRAAANVIVTDRINASDDVFFVTKGVMDRLTKNGEGAIKVNYVVAKTGDGTTAWGDKGNSWYVAGNVRSSDIFMLYEQLLKLGYKPRISSDSSSLEIPYVVEHRWSMLMSDLESLRADVSAIVKTEMEMNPMRL